MTECSALFGIRSNDGHGAIPGLPVVGDEFIAHAEDKPRLNIQLELLQDAEVFIRLGRLFAFFDLDGVHLIPLDDQQVDLLLVDVAVVEQVNRLACVVVALDNLRHYIGLKEGSVHRTILQRFRSGPAAEIGGEAGVHEVHLGRLDQPFGDVGVVRPQDEDDAGSLQNGHPRLGGGSGHADGAGDLVVLQLLSGPCRHIDEEIVELVQLSHLCQILDVPLNVGVDVVHIEAVTVEVCGAQLGHTAQEDVLIHLVDVLALAVLQPLPDGFQVGMEQVGGTPLDLRRGQARHIEDSDAASQRLGNILHHFELL